MKKNKKAYVVINEGEIVFASFDKNEADGFADDKAYDARNQVLEEWDIDDPDSKDLCEAEMQSGFDNGVWEVFEVDMSMGEEDEEISIDGEFFEYNDILEKLK